MDLDKCGELGNIITTEPDSPAFIYQEPSMTARPKIQDPTNSDACEPGTPARSQWNVCCLSAALWPGMVFCWSPPLPPDDPVFDAPTAHVLTAEGFSRRWALLYGLVLACGVILACGLGSFGLPCPRGDDAMYKSPAAELAQHGRLAIPCAVGFLPKAETVFACYPPVYQLLLAAWYAVFGVSLRASLAYTYTVHLLSVAAIMEVARRLLPGESPPQRAGLAIVGAVGLIHLANLSYFDRQEETALLWIWLELLITSAAQGGLLRAAASGLWVGLAGLTSPWVGLLGLLLVTLRTFFTTAQTG